MNIFVTIIIGYFIGSKIACAQDLPPPPINDQKEVHFFFKFCQYLNWILTLTILFSAIFPVEKLSNKVHYNNKFVHKVDHE